MDRIKIQYLNIISRYHYLQNIFEYIFIFLSACYVMCFVIQSTMFEFFVVGTMSSLALKFMWWVTIARIFFFLGQWKEWKINGILGMVTYCIYLFQKDAFLLFLTVMILGCINIDLRTILKVHFLTVGGIVLLAVIASFTGTIENLVYLKDGWAIRDSFGICYPTDFASYLFYLLLFFWIAWKKIPGWISMLIGIPFLLIVRIYAISDTCTICGVAFYVVLFILPLVERYLVKENRFPKLKKVIDVCLVLAFVLFAALAFGLIALYALEKDGSNAAGISMKINELLTGRIGFAYDAFLKYGIHWKGSPLKQQGSGAMTFLVSDYDFVDSSYPLIFLRNGGIVFAWIAFLWTRMAWLAVRKKDYRLAFGMGLITLHSFVEHHFTEVNYNILLFLPCAVFWESGNSLEVEIKMFEQRQRKTTVTVAAIFAVGIMALPYWVQCMRTMCGAMRMKDGSHELLFVICLTLMTVVAFALIFRGVKGILNTPKEKKRQSQFVILASGIALLILQAGILSVVMRRSLSEADSLWIKDSEILVALDQAADGKIYSTELPVFYRKKLKNFGYSILNGDDLARKKNATIIAKRGVDYYVLFRKDFYYAAISDDTAIYSNDQSVLGKLREIGVTPKSYFDEIRYIELPTNLAPLINLRAGTYTIRCRLKVNYGEMMPENLAEITMVGDKGFSVIAKRMIPATSLSESGEAEFEMRVEIERETVGIMFYVLGKEGCSIEVTELSYQMTP